MAKFYYFLGHEQFQPEELVEHAIEAEKAGFDGVFVSEHFNPWVADAGASGFAFSTLGAIAVVTKQLELMTGVVTPLFRYHPAVVAQAAATIDRLSNGRFSLGVGTGESLNESPLGYSFPNYAERSERMREGLAIMKKLLTKEKVTYTGKYYRTENVKLYSPPKTEVPIYLAAGGPKSAILAAEHADGVIISVKNIADTKEKVILPVKEKIESKAFAVIASRWTVFAKNDEEAWTSLASWRGLRAPNRDTAKDPESLQKEADALEKKEIISKYTVVSSAEDYLETYKPLITVLDADIVVIQTTTHTNQKSLISFLGKEVVPELKKTR